TFCYDLGQTFQRGSLFRQAIREYERVQQLSPKEFAVALSLASVYVQGRAPGLAQALIKKLRTEESKQLSNPTNAIILASIEGAAFLAETKTNTAVELFRQAEQTYPQNPDLLTLIARVYASNGMFTNALEATDKQLKLTPDSPEALLNKAAYCIELKEY